MVGCYVIWYSLKNGKNQKFGLENAQILTFSRFFKVVTQNLKIKSSSFLSVRQNSIINHRIIPTVRDLKWSGLWIVDAPRSSLGETGLMPCSATLVPQRRLNSVALLNFTISTLSVSLKLLRYK